jgi:metallo-beta-lactamase family protein
VEFQAKVGTDFKSVLGWLASETGNKEVVMINISHHGAVSGVIGSCHELSITPPDRSNPSAGILIDCGLFQGADPLTTKL